MGSLCRLFGEGEKIPVVVNGKQVVITAGDVRHFPERGIAQLAVKETDKSRVLKKYQNKVGRLRPDILVFVVINFG